MNSFHQGWHDRLWGIPVPQERKRLPQQVSYERGRHCAALWQFFIKLKEQEGTIHVLGPDPQHATYAHAIDHLTLDFYVMMKHEENFCATLKQRFERMVQG